LLVAGIAVSIEFHFIFPRACRSSIPKAPSMTFALSCGAGYRLINLQNLSTHDVPTSLP
jgi:hypothetical protein